MKIKNDFTTVGEILSSSSYKNGKFFNGSLRKKTFQIIKKKERQQDGKSTQRN